MTERCAYCGAWIVDEAAMVDFEGELFCDYECFAEYCDEEGIPT